MDTMVLPFQDASLGEGPASEEEPSVLENIMSSIGKLMNYVIVFCRHDRQERLARLTVRRLSPRLNFTACG